MTNRSNKPESYRQALTLSTLALLSLSQSGCMTLKQALALPAPGGPSGPIVSPFSLPEDGGAKAREPIVLRTKQGDRAVELELPSGQGELSDFALPLSPVFRADGGGSQQQWNDSSHRNLDETYSERTPSLTDREIARSLPEPSGELALNRSEIEQNLGLSLTEETASPGALSYLAQVDRVKQLYRLARFEAALIELDQLLREYPTDPKLHEMRGTLLDRSGRPELALRAWNESLRLRPENQSLKKFVERKTRLRSLASPPQSEKSN